MKWVEALRKVVEDEKGQNELVDSGGLAMGKGKGKGEKEEKMGEMVGGAIAGE